MGEGEGMTTWTDGLLCSFDIESTGVNPDEDRIVTASVVVIDGTTGKYDTHEWLVNPGVDIPEEASKLHGVTTEYAATYGKPPDEAIPNIYSTVLAALSRGAVLVVYNAPFDCTMLDREMLRHTGMSAFPNGAPNIVDPLCLDRSLDPYRKTRHVGGRTLTTVSAHYGVPIAEKDAHGSTQDALCAARVAWKIGKRFPTECGDLGKLQDFQRRQHAAWATHTNEYFRSQGKPADIGLDWPYKPLPVAVPA